MVKHVTFNHYNMGSNPISLNKKYIYIYNIKMYRGLKSSPHWNAQPRYLRHLAGKMYAGPIRALEVEIDLGLRGSPVYSLTFSIKL